MCSEIFCNKNETLKKGFEYSSPNNVQNIATIQHALRNGDPILFYWAVLLVVVFERNERKLFNQEISGLKLILEQSK